MDGKVQAPRDLSGGENVMKYMHRINDELMSINDRLKNKLEPVLRNEPPMDPKTQTLGPSAESPFMSEMLQVQMSVLNNIQYLESLCDRIDL